MNKVILIGRLTDDPELRHTTSGTAVATYRLAVNRQYKQEGQPEADFLNCVAWKSGAEFASKYLHKGMKIAVEGRIQIRTYENNENKKVYVTEIIVEQHEFCDGKKSNDGGSNSVPNSSIDDLAKFNNVKFEEMDDDGDLPF